MHCGTHRAARFGYVGLSLLGLMALAVAAATGARAQTPAQREIAATLERWGLLGNWSLDCSQPPSRQNGYLNYVVQGPGIAMHVRHFGDTQDANEVLGANLQPDGAIELIVHFQSFGQTRKYVMIKRDDRIRAISNSNDKNAEFTIRDGKFVHNGNETPWQTRCK